jgi:hypothetical protein
MSAGRTSRLDLGGEDGCPPAPRYIPDVVGVLDSALEPLHHHSQLFAPMTGDHRDFDVRVRNVHRALEDRRAAQREERRRPLFVSSPASTTAANLSPLVLRAEQDYTLSLERSALTFSARPGRSSGTG